MPQLKMVQGVAKLIEEFEKDLPKSIAGAVLGKSFEFMPVDSGHMMRQTRMVERKDGKGYQLVTSTDYAMGQYTKLLHHYIVGGRYRSISRANVGISLDEGRELKSLRGGAKFSKLYWIKYAYLRAAGKLSAATPEWFLQGYEAVMNGEFRALAAARIVELRKRARESAGIEKRS